MQTRKFKVKVLLMVSMALLMFTNMVTYVLLLTQNEKWKKERTEVNINTSVVAEVLTEHVYYDGDSIPCNQEVRHYNRSGNLMEGKSLSEVLQGDKVVMLLSPNCCLSCAKGEIEKLLELAKKIGRENIVIVADYAMHTESFWSENFDKEGYYETDMEHLGLEGSPTREAVVVMLTRNGRVKTSFIVGPHTIDFAGRFHEYLTTIFKGKK